MALNLIGPLFAAARMAAIRLQLEGFLAGKPPKARAQPVVMAPLECLQGCAAGKPNQPFKSPSCDRTPKHLWEPLRPSNIVSYHIISYHIISYHIISDHNISYHIMYIYTYIYIYLCISLYYIMCISVIIIATIVTVFLLLELSLLISLPLFLTFVLLS